MEFKGIALVFFLVAAIAADPHYKPHDADDLDTYHILEHLFENNGEHAEDYLDLSELENEEELPVEYNEEILPGDLQSAVS